MGGRGRVAGQRLGVADIDQPRHQLQRVDEAPGHVEAGLGRDLLEAPVGRLARKRHTRRIRGRGTRAVEDVRDQHDIPARGDAAVKDWSAKFDNWAPESFRLTREQIDAAYAELDSQVIEDIRFAQAQVRNFAQIQRDALKDVCG